MNISWQYIAGFFDGEGCVNVYETQGYLRPYCSMVQAEPRQEVILKISEFLDMEGIDHRIDTAEQKGYGWKPLHRLQITKRSETLKFLRAIQPYAIAKKADVDRVAEWIEKNPPKAGRKRLHADKQAKRMLELWEDGMSQSQIACKFKTHQVAVSRAISKLQISV
jgi:hypothetical protein